MSLPDPTGRDHKSDNQAPLNTVPQGKINVLNYAIESNLFAAMCYLPIPPANLIACFIGLNTPADDLKFIRFNAMQSAMVSGGFLVIYTLLSTLMWVIGLIPFIGGLINVVLGIALFLVIAGYVLASLKLCLSAYAGQTFELPYIAPYARQYSKT